MDAVRHRPPSGLAFIAAAVILAGCGLDGAPSAEPWNAPVESAASVTEWAERGPMQVGPGGGGVGSPERLLEQLELMALGIATEGAIADSRLLLDDDPPLAWVRATGPAGQQNLQAYEAIFEIRMTDAGAWTILRARERYHCAASIATDFCQ